MKNLTIKLRKFAFTYLLLFAMMTNANAQLVIADFEDLDLQPDTCWYGVDSTGGFTSGELFFANKFSDWGVYTSWAGFAYSNKIDTITPGFGNQYSAYSGYAHDSSSNFGIYYNDGMSTYRMSRGPSLANDTIAGVYITNDTYAALSMKEGDAFTKKFGGTSGDDPDWFVLTVYAYKNGVKKTDTVDFYLADYRFSNNSLDYIVKDWTWVDLHSLGKIDSLEFKLRSTDNGLYGMNTPAYFCFDNFYKKASGSGMRKGKDDLLKISVYPNPAVENIILNSTVTVQNMIIYNADGKLIENVNDINAKVFNLNVKSYNSGVYFMKCTNDDNQVFYTKFIKN
jgi:hypothetical protein